MKKMFLDKKSKVNDPKVYATKREMELDQQLTKLKTQNENLKKFAELVSMNLNNEERPILKEINKRAKELLKSII